MIKQLTKINGVHEIQKAQQKRVNGGLTLYVASCSPAVNGARCHAEGGLDGHCAGFVCSPDCPHT